MEARAQFREARVAKGVVALVAVSIVLGLGSIAASSLAKSAGAPAAATQTHFVQSQGGPAVTNPARRGGTQAVPDLTPTPSNHSAAPSPSIGKHGYF
jgi:hypothetical protein